MIHILYLSHCGSSIGGGEKQLYYLVKHLDRQRYAPLVVCPEEGIFVQQLRTADIPTTVLNLPPWRKVKSRFTRRTAATKLANIAQKHKTQLIHTSDSWLNPYLACLRRRHNGPVISHVRNILTRKQVPKYAFDKMDSIITISEESKLPLLQAGIAPEKIDVIHNCVDLTKFKPKHVESTMDPSQYVIGIVGRIEPFKKQKTFIEIANRVVQQNPNVRFKVIGAALDGHKHKAYEREVRQMVSAYNLEKIVDFTGHRDDMPEAMRELNLLVTLSAGSVIAEAMASGIPVIGTPVGSTHDMIVDGLTGYVVPLDPIQRIVAKIGEFATDMNISIQFGQNARRYAEANFSVNKHVQQIENVYKKLYHF